jgi:hypothetical protein
MSDTAAASSSSSSSRTCPTAPRRFQIKVPATSANIGPGFDVVGLSLSLHVVLDVSIDPCVPPPALAVCQEAERALWCTRVACQDLRG